MPVEEQPVPSAQDAEPWQTEPKQPDTTSRVNVGEQPVPGPSNTSPRQGPSNASPRQGPSNTSPRQGPSNTSPRQGPSNASPRQGFCSCCQALYSSVEQHILSPRHREVVRAARANVASGSLMERFLQDVLQHHPHHYNDTRPTHADLPSLSTPLVPHEELSEVYCGSEDDGVSVGTREEMPSSDDESCQLMFAEGTSSALRSGRKAGSTASAVAAEVAPATSAQTDLEPGKARLDPPPSGKDSPTWGFLHRTGGSSTLATPNVTQTPLPGSQRPSPARPGSTKGPSAAQVGSSQFQHRKAHRKTNRHREGSDSAPASPVSPVSPASKCITSRDQAGPRPAGESQAGPGPAGESQAGPGPRGEKQAGPGPAGESQAGPGPRGEKQAGSGPAGESQAGPGPAGESSAVWTPVWTPWKGARRQRTFSDHSDKIRDVIEEVIERHCYGRSPKRNQQEDEGSFHISLGSMSDSGCSEGWDSPVQAALATAKGGDKNLACLMEVHINLEDQGYKTQLDTALNTALLTPWESGEPGAGGAAGSRGGGWSTVEEVLPDLPHIPQSFVGKTLTQVMYEDDLKVDSMVREFREGQYLCYFDSESLARFGKHGKKGKRGSQEEEEEEEEEGGGAGEWICKEVLPLAEHHEDDGRCRTALRRTRGRVYRLASRCQVVKVSHGTQTTPLSCPSVRRRALQETGTSADAPEPQQDPSPEQTPDMKTRLCALRLPASYCRIMSPVQPKTVVYVLSSPDTGQPAAKPAAVRRVGRKRKSYDSECALKYKYKKVPLKYYDPATNRILKTPPSAPNPKPPHVRQLFRSLSPDINKARQGAEQGRGSRRRRAGSSLADLCASTSGSCLESGGPSEPGSSASGSRRALFTRSSVSSGSRFLLGALTPAPSHAGSASRAPAPSSVNSARRAPTSEPGGVGRGRAGARGRRSSRREGLTEKPLTPPTPPYRTRSAKPQPTAKSRSPLQRRVSPHKAAGSRTSPRNKSPASASPRASPSPTPSSKLLPALITRSLRRRVKP